MYLFDNELFAIECMAKYAMEGLIVKYRGIHDGHGDEFAHCPEPECKGDWGYYLTYNDHQHQGLLQSKDMGYRCFYTGKVSNWLKPEQPNFFELYGIFKYYITGEHSGMHGKVGELHPRYKKPGIWTGAMGGLHPASKAIIAVQPDGTKSYFASVKEAAEEAGIFPGNLTRLIRNKRPLKKGKCKGFQFFFAEQK
jgi:hypothetical protein